jgi:hypothetical protein
LGGIVHFVLLVCGLTRVKRISGWLFDTDHPLRVAVVCLLIAAGNAYEAVYIDSPRGFMNALSWVCTAGGIIGLLLFLLVAVSDHFSKIDG